jgi:predicted SAM-dependent methyltransferase
MDYLNLGCGLRYDPTWTNINFNSTGKSVIAHDITKGIPFPDESFEVVYHSHLLEHLPKSAAFPFLKECYRVLRPEGILRVAVPDLEQITRTYLTTLEEAISGAHEAANNYEWILLEMYDQMVRDRTGGEMKSYMTNENIANKEFMFQRVGLEGKQGRDAELKASPFKHSLKKIYNNVLDRQDRLLSFLLGKHYQAIKIGYFRLSGETHQCMYDRYSLSLLFRQCGLEKIIQRSATESYIKNWADFNLDTEVDGTVVKPDSLFVEAIKG